MIYLKKINEFDALKEYNFFKEFPYNENGFLNDVYKYSFEEFKNVYIPYRIKCQNEENLKKGFVPDTYFFLWDDDMIVGLFKVRHYLNDILRDGAGHIGYGILPSKRGKGYAKIGLGLAIKELKKVIKEDEVYLSCYKYNLASLKVMKHNNGYIHHEDETKYFVRIKI